MRQKLRSVVAEDYFLKNSLLAWFSLNILNIISLKRHNLSHRENPLLSCSEALSQGDILIIYPEGTKGEPHSLALIWLKLTLIFLFMDGLRKLLPKGEILLVSFLYDIFVEENIDWTGIKKSFMDLLNQLIQNLASQGKFPSWE
ncbi:1-acyl-sn-glycerol-3-phosphate acyltransferase [Calothrix sp. PCC 6303]|uniref:1-acyl-sn-glycerol-3-phosphate acyltransferase n=1 Tax=Calothrix sp. PCC 6303 TaxID=1170562 RepID=UPI00193AD4FF|nr:1-acyl-sn-glycerol-3-phosphate acyltransferase [Calothrix sp. PCC 6303]